MAKELMLRVVTLLAGTSAGSGCLTPPWSDGKWGSELVTPTTILLLSEAQVQECEANTAPGSAPT